MDFRSTDARGRITVIMLLISASALSMVACAEDMPPPNSENIDICEPEVSSSDRDSCMINDGESVGIDKADDLDILCTAECDTINGISFQSVSGLETLGVLKGFSDIDQMSLISNPDLTTLEGLGGVEIPGGMSISGNNALTSLAGVTEDEIVDLIITSNDSLENLKGLESVKSIGMRRKPEVQYPLGKLEVAENENLKSLDGLNNVETLYRARIIDNESLERINALSDVTVVEKHLTISDNPSLKSIESLMGIEKIEGGLGIQNNPSLPSCQVQEFLNNVEVNENYQVDVGNNGSGSCE
jgi:hypothetical protein